MDDWTKFIPRTLFTAKDGSPIHVILDILDETNRKDISEIIESRGGFVTYSSPSPFAIILTDQEQRQSRYPTYPTFDVKWIIDCIESVELIDINPYLIEKSEGRNFMDVIYHKLETSDGTFVVETDKQFQDDWKMMERKKCVGNNRRRRGPAKKEDNVQLLVDCTSNEDDFYNVLATSVLTTAIEKILLNERSLISMTKDQLKKYDSGLEDRIGNNECQSSFQWYNKKSRNLPMDDEVLQSHSTFSTSGENEKRSITMNRSSSTEASDDFLIGHRDCTIVDSSELMGTDSFKKITNRKKLQCSVSALPLSSRVVERLPKNRDEPPDSPTCIPDEESLPTFNLKLLE